MMDVPDEIHAMRIDESIRMLNTYVKESSIKPVITLLEALKQDPSNESLLVQLSETLDTLGVTQGAVLTYAPYVSILLSDDLFGSE